MATTLQKGTFLQRKHKPVVKSVLIFCIKHGLLRVEMSSIMLNKNQALEARMTSYERESEEIKIS